MEDDDGVMWDLIPFNVSIPLGGSYDDLLPGWGTGELVSASTALILDSTPVQLTAAPAFLGQNYSGTRYTLDSSSLVEVTDQVSEDGRIKLDFPLIANGTEYQLFAYYQNHTSGWLSNLRSISTLRFLNHQSLLSFRMEAGSTRILTSKVPIWSSISGRSICSTTTIRES